MSKKNIDDLFQEKLKDFDEVPDERVWKAIASSLDKQKNSRKIIPLWWKISGLAAGLALLLYVVNPFNNSLEQKETITNIEERKKTVPNETAPMPKESFVLPEKGQEIIVDAATSNVRDANPTKRKLLEKGAPAQVAKQENTSSSNSPERIRNQNIPNEGTVFPESAKVAESPSKGEKNPNTELVVAKAEEPSKAILNPEDDKNKKLTSTETVAQVEAIAQENNKKKSIFEVIEEQEKEDAIAEKRKEKWSVGPSVAPVYFNAMGEGSPIHSNFVSNSKSGQTNLSYGMVVSYELSEKLRIRSGIHKANYGYNTNEIEFSSSAELGPSALISNIDYAMASRNVVVNSRKTEAFNDPSIAADALAANSSRDGLMSQNFGYLEVPLELNYALLDKKFGINLIGGVSSLFLMDNSISLESGGLATEVGEANNLNNVNFSTNIGFGVNYKFTPQLQLNVEPLFKYQLNTFSQTSGTFNPFSIGIYSGINFKF